MDGMETTHTARHPSASTPADAPPRLPLTWWGLGIRLLVAVAILLGLNILTAVGFMALSPVLGDDEGLLFTLELARFGVVLAGTVGFVGLWMRLVERRRLRDAGWVVSIRGAGMLLVGTGVSVAIVAVLFALNAVAGMPIFAETTAYDALVGSAPMWAVLLYVFGLAFALQGIPEELIFRGWLFNIVIDRPWLAFWWTTVSFTAIHLLSDGGQQDWYDYLAYLAIPFGFGALAGALVLLTGSMWIAAGVHGGFHVGHALVVLLTGQAFVPTGWAPLVVGAAFLVPTALVLRRWSRRRRA